MYKALGFKWLFECFCPASAFATADSDEARNPQRFIHVSVNPKQRKQKFKVIFSDKVPISDFISLNALRIWSIFKLKRLEN
jgi:hypothetical protein